MKNDGISREKAGFRKRFGKMENALSLKNDLSVAVVNKRKIVSFKGKELSIVFITLALVVFGIIMQYSASCYSAESETGDSFFYVKKQAVSAIVGLVAMLLVPKLKLKYLFKARYIILAIAYVLLALVFVPGLGVEKYGARRWINLGFTTLQPSEVAKFALVIFIAGELSKKSAVTFKNMLPILIATAIMCVLIMLEPNMSITMCVGAVMLIMLFIGGMKFKHFAAFAVPIAVLIPLMILLEPYRLKRLMAFLDPWASPQGEGYQLIQSFYALGSGGFFGVGLFNSRQKYLFLPFAESDFIFSIIGEELGFVGSFFVIAVFVLIIFYGIRTAMRAEDRFSMFLVAGITAIIAVQSVINIAVVSGSIPPTGLPLPFVSSGGSSLVMFMSGVGIMRSVALSHT